MFYNLILYGYYFFVYLASFNNEKAKKWIHGRKKLWNDLPKIENKQVIWFHCASLGEFDQGLPLMNKYKSENPELFLLVTFFSPSGIEHYQKRKNFVDFACYIPLDTTKNAEKFLNHFKPSLVFFVKYEFWRNHLKLSKKQDAEVYSICSIFRPKHRFFKSYGFLFNKALTYFDHFFVQTEESVTLLNKIGINQTSLVGDMRFDNVIENRKHAKPDHIVLNFLQNKKCLILGSSWPVDEQFLADFIKQNLNGKIIIVPHDISEKHINEIENLFLNETVRYSLFDANSNDKKILIVDGIGKLNSMYQHANIAYVGGGFTGKLHNILEPLVYGVPTMIGPKYSRFPEATYFLEQNCVFSMNDKKDIQRVFTHIDLNKQEISKKIIHLVESQAGASDKIYAYIKNSSSYFKT